MRSNRSIVRRIASAGGRHRWTLRVMLTCLMIAAVAYPCFSSERSEERREGGSNVPDASKVNRDVGVLSPSSLGTAPGRYSAPKPDAPR